MRTVGGSVRLSTFGSRLDRGHTFSVPHSPIGITGALVIWASRAAPQRPFSSGSKNAGPRGIVPCGMIATTSPPARASAAASQRLVRAARPVDPDAAHRRGQLADDRYVEHLLLAEEAHGAPALAMTTDIAAGSK